MLDFFKFYDNNDPSLIVFPFVLFIVGSLFFIFIFNKKQSLLYSVIFGIYLSLLICILFFPVVTNYGDNYNFSEDIKHMITFYNPYYRFIHQPRYSICHLIMFIPLGYLIKEETSLIKSILVCCLIIFSIENIQIYINYFTKYVQYTYCIADIFFHIISSLIGITINYIKNRRWT